MPRTDVQLGRFRNPDNDAQRIFERFYQVDAGLGVCPHQRHHRARRPSGMQSLLGPVRFVPHLLRQESRSTGERFERTELRFGISTSGQLVVCPLARQQRPGSPDAGSQEGATVGALAVSIVVVPAPARANSRLDTQHRIHHPQRVLDERIAGSANNWGDGRAAKDRQLAEGSPALVVLGTDDDLPAAWVRTGEAAGVVKLAMGQSEPRVRGAAWCPTVGLLADALAASLLSRRARARAERPAG